MIEYKNLNKVLEDYMEVFSKELKDNYKESNASGSLINSVRTNVKHMGYNWQVVVTLNDYYEYIENGRKPGSKGVPVDKLIQWIKVKPILPRPNRSNGKLPTPSQLSFLINRKIKEKGIKAKPIMKDTIESVNTKFTKKITEALVKDIIANINVKKD